MSDKDFSYKYYVQRFHRITMLPEFKIGDKINFDTLSHLHTIIRKPLVYRLLCNINLSIISRHICKSCPIPHPCKHYYSNKKINKMWEICYFLHHSNVL